MIKRRRGSDPWVWQGCKKKIHILLTENQSYKRRDLFLNSLLSGRHMNATWMAKKSPCIDVKPASSLRVYPKRGHEIHSIGEGFLFSRNMRRESGTWDWSMHAVPNVSFKEMNAGNECARQLLKGWASEPPQRRVVGQLCRKTLWPPKRRRTHRYWLASAAEALVAHEPINAFLADKTYDRRAVVAKNGSRNMGSSTARTAISLS